MEQEAEYFAALESAATYSVEGNILEMRDAADALAVRMERQLNVTVPPPGPAVPTGRVTAPAGINVRTGPGTNFPVLGTAPYATEGEIIGRSVDGRWWVVAVPSAPGGSGWVSADFVAARDVADVPMIAAPPPPIVVPAPTPLPTPTPRPQPTATPSAQLSFRATQTTINQGSCTTLEWSVENVQAVWVFPQGRPYQQYPRVGQGSEQVCPPTTTTYEMRVLLRDGTVTTQRVTVNVTPGAPQNPLNGTAWQVTGFYTGRGAVVSPLVGTNLTTRFEATQLSGQGGCNEFAGGYSVSGSNISIGALASGLVMCSDIPGTMEQESDFLAALQSSATFRFDGNRLEMRRADGTVTVFFTRLQ
jgi:heat shock protein HslJ